MTWGLIRYHVHRWVLFAVLPSLLVAVTSLALTLHESKQYRSSVLLYVEQPSGRTGLGLGGDVLSSEQIVPTYSAMLLSPVVAAATDAAMARRFPGYRLADHEISVSPVSPSSGLTVTSTQLIQIDVQDTIPGRAAQGAASVAQAFVRRLHLMQREQLGAASASIQAQIHRLHRSIEELTSRIQRSSRVTMTAGDVRVQRAEAIGSYRALLSAAAQFTASRSELLDTVRIFSPATTPPQAVDTHQQRAAMLGGLLALVLASVGLYLYEQVNDMPRSPEEIEVVLRAPVLGTARHRDQHAFATPLSPSLSIPEEYERIRANIEFGLATRDCRTLLVTSCSQGEGKTTTVANLAAAFAAAGREVTIVDGDLRRPRLHHTMGAPDTPGLTTTLIGNDDPLEVRMRVHGYANLRIVPAGPLPPRPADLLGTDRMAEILTSMSQQSDIVFVDSPPVLSVADSVVISRIVDGVLLVVDPGRTSRGDLERTRHELENVGAVVTAVILNKLRRRDRHYVHFARQYRYAQQHLKEVQIVPAIT